MEKSQEGIKMDKSKYFFKFDKLYTSEDLLSFFHNIPYSEQQTFVWIINSKLPKFLKDADGDLLVTYNFKLNIDLLFGRPVFYDDDVQENCYEFRAYK